eukprot:SAG31_NODE_2079_length_6498_cov_3.416159_3_plen_44_part_00
MFLAQDHSVSQGMLEKIGLGSTMPGVDGSQVRFSHDCCRGTCA